MLKPIVGLCALLCLSVEPILAGPTLDGQWEVIAKVTPNGPEIWRDPFQAWVFEGNSVTYRTGRPAIPIDGAEFDVTIDLSVKPNRMQMSYDEGDKKEVFAHCIFDQHDDILVMRMLIPFALNSSQVKQEAIESFRRSSFPRDFKPGENDATVVLVLRKSTKKLPAVNNDVIFPRDDTDSLRRTK